MIWRLLRANWRLKLGATIVLNLFFWAGYGLLERYPLFPIQNVPLTALDRAVPYAPEPWGWVYFSQYIFTAALPWLLTERLHIRRYAFGFAGMASMSFAVFLFCPTASPRPMELGSSFPMVAIAQLDGRFNAFPSLHAAFIVYMGMLAWRMFGSFAPRLTLGVAVTWGVAILYSTLATKQHYALDLAAGAAIGAFADWLAWRGSAAAATIPRRRECASQAGVR